MPDKRNHNDSLTVMQVVPELKVGGVERGTIEFAGYLQKQGHRPIVVSAGGPLVEQLSENNITHIELNVGKKSLSSLKSIKKLKNIMLDRHVDVVHARSRLPAWLCYWAIKRIKSKKPKFVTTLHGVHSVNRYSSIMARGDAVIAVSQTAQDYLIRNFKKQLGHEPELIYRGIDPQFSYGHVPDQSWLTGWQQKFGTNESIKTVLLPGRLSQLKGVEHLVRWLKSTKHDCKLLLTADYDESKYSHQVSQLFAQHGLSERVIWLGIERNMPNLYAAVDVVVSTNNKAESFGRTVLEALSIGKPVVAFSHGGVDEIMNALFPEGKVPVGNDVALAQCIDSFLSQKPVVKPHQLFTNRDMFEKTLAVYQRLLVGGSVNA